MPHALPRRDIRGALLGADLSLRYRDGRPPRSGLAVSQGDLDCVIAMLKEPAKADVLHRTRARLRSRELVVHARELKAHSQKLRSDAGRIVREIGADGA